MADEVDRDYGTRAEMDARDHAHRGRGGWKTTKLLEVLAALHVEKTAVVKYIWHHEAFWTARGWGGMIARIFGI